MADVLDPTTQTGIQHGKFAHSADDDRAYLLVDAGAIPVTGLRDLMTVGNLTYMGADWFGYTGSLFWAEPASPAPVGDNLYDGQQSGFFAAGKTWLSGGAGATRFLSPDFIFTASETLDPRITASGGDNGTRFNSSGTLVAATTPRYDYDPVTLEPGGLLIEVSRTNLLLNSLIDGTSLSTQDVTVTEQSYTISFFGSGSITLSGAHSATLNSAGASPVRTTLTFTPSAGTLTCTVSGEVKWAQCEAGAFATSFIPTAGSPVTRTADTLTMSGADFSDWWSPAEGTWIVEADSVAIGVRAILWLQNSGATNWFVHYLNSTLLTTGKNTTATGQTAFSPGNTLGEPFKYAFAYAADDIAASLNGAAAVADPDGSLPSVDSLRFGSIVGDTDQLCGHIRRFRYIPRRLSNTQLQALAA